MVIGCRLLSSEVRWGEWGEVKSLSRVWLFATLWTVAHQASPSMRFSRQEYWSGLPLRLSPHYCRLPHKQAKQLQRKATREITGADTFKYLSSWQIGNWYVPRGDGQGTDNIHCTYANPSSNFMLSLEWNLDSQSWHPRLIWLLPTWSPVPFLPAWSPTQRQLLTFCSLPAGTICLNLLANPSLELE